MQLARALTALRSRLLDVGLLSRIPWNGHRSLVVYDGEPTVYCDDNDPSFVDDVLLLIAARCARTLR